MRPRRGVLLAAAFAVVVGLAVARSVRAGAYGDGPYAFPHQPHLSAETVAAALGPAGRRPGADRECRVCHDYEKGDAAHLGGCATCHVDAKHLDVKLRDAPPATTFPHKAHLKDPSITCFTCHEVQREMGWVEFSNPAAGLGAVGANGAPGGRYGESTCADCHRAHEPRGGKVKQDDVTGDGKPCGTCHAGTAPILPRKHRDAAPGGADGNHTFRHEDHGGADRSCDDCHAPIRGSRSIWDYDPTAGTADACRACHVDAAGKPLVAVDPARSTTLPYVRFDRFPHDRHLGPTTGKVETSGKVTDGCRTCHYPEKDAAAWKLFPGRAISAEPVGRDALVSYEACLPCHANWKVEGHGVDDWACFKCHAGTQPVDGKLPLGTAQVHRPRDVRVSFTSHAHPAVTREGRQLPRGHDAGKPCRDCHVADVASIPARSDGAFRHAAHVAPNPSASECIACHPSTATASWSGDVLRFDRSAAPTASAPAAKECRACHVGAWSDRSLVFTTGGRSVREFDHKSHVTAAPWKGATGIACTECHLATDDGAGFATAPDAEDCSRCHSHDEKQTEKRARTGPSLRSPDAAKACVHCHGDLTQPPPEVARGRQHLALLPGKQHHDKTGDCASCHAREGRPYQYVERIASAKVALSIHEDASLAREWFNDPRIAQTPDAQGRSCRTCHRTEPRGYLRALSSR